MKNVLLHGDSIRMGYDKAVENTLKMIDAWAVFSTAWKYEGKKVQIFVNHTTEDIVVAYDGRQIIIKALCGHMEEM